MVDGTLLLINGIWAVVVLTAVAVAGLALRRFAFKDKLANEVDDIIGNMADLRHRLNADEREAKGLEEVVLKLKKDFDFVRAELEKLKAIPHKQSRY